MYRKIVLSIVLVLISMMIVVYTVISCAKERNDELQTNDFAMENIGRDSEYERVENKRNLIVYFSRYGNTDYPENVDATTSASIVSINNRKYGATEYIADVIQNYVGGDVVLIETEEPYPENFSEVVMQNHLEQQQEFLPKLKHLNINLDDYDVVYVGYPVWATTMPQAVSSFLQKFDFSGKTIIPFCTHDGYGSGSSYEDIKSIVPSTNVLLGLDINSQDILYSQLNVENWLKQIGQLKENRLKQKEIPVVINIGDKKIDAVFYDTKIANEISKNFPLKVNMLHYSDREYYGYLTEKINTDEKGKLNFDNGDITYCKQNNTIAIFYNQSSNPNLTMEVIPIGKVISDLSVFNELSSNEDMSFSLK